MFWSPPQDNPDHPTKQPIWPFGYIVPGSATAPVKREAVALNWVTEVTWYELPGG